MLSRKLVMGSQIKRRYKLTIEEYNERLALQEGRCFTCKQIPSGGGNFSRLQLDHCHNTGKVGKFLCGHCNAALGMAKDSIQRLEALIVYLREFR